MKKLNTQIKLIILLAIISVFMLIFSAKVQATTGIVVSGEPTENSLDTIPSTITLDIPEVEYEKASEVAYSQIATILKEQGIAVDSGSDDTTVETGIALTVRAFIKDTGIIPRNIEISLEDKSNNKTIAKKEITFTYNNSSKYNETDKKYVKDLIKNINLPANPDNAPDFVDASYIWNDYFELDTKKGPTFESLIGDSNIQVVDAFFAFGDGELFHGCYGTVYGFFKNGVYYGSVALLRNYIAQITVPENIEDTEKAYIEYAKPKIQDYLNKLELEVGFEVKMQIKSMEKINGYYYNVFLTSGDYDDIIIRKAKGAPTGNDIFVNNISKDINITSKPIQSSTVMITKVEEKGYTDILGSYELTLTGADKLTEPIDLTFTVDEKYNNQTVYILHQKKDGSFESFEEKVVNGKVTITVSELSPFTLAVKVSAEKPEDKPQDKPEEKPSEETPQTPNNSNDDKLDETPKTGDNFNSLVLVSAIAIISLVGIGVLKIKKI